jgi:NAD(P)-dependent dehydrogenase (short-subunit alcohol dehydrogenase family)
MPTVLITGANRGLGLEFVRQYEGEGWDVIACCREPRDADQLHAVADEASHVRIEPLDVSDFPAVDALAHALRDTPIDLLLNNAGVFGPRVTAENDWRQSFGHLDYALWQRVLAVNLLAPVKMCEAFINHVAASEKRRMAVISSKLASIATTEPGHYFYRTSKAALNSAMATLAVELRSQGIAVGIYCPGWVATDMGGRGAPLTPAESVAGLRQHLDALDMSSSGVFTHHDGEVLPW